MNYCLNIIKECRKSNTKVACVVSSKSNPKLVDFPIVANDSNETSIKFIFNYIINNIKVSSDSDLNNMSNE